MKAATTEGAQKIRAALAVLSDIDVKHYHFEK